MQLPPLLALMRPHQWLKNVFVFAGLVFSSRADEAAMAELAALLAAGGVVLANGNRTLLGLIALYVASNVAYSWWLKRVPVVDVFSIALGFMLRLLAGTVGVGIPPSRWLILTGIFAALFLGFSKRRAETFQAAASQLPGGRAAGRPGTDHRDVATRGQASQRSVLGHYPPALLDTFVSVTMTATLMTYSLFATSPESQAQHGERLVYTVPIVIFGMLRYAYQVHRGRGEDVARDLLRDPWIVGALAAWLLVFIAPLLVASA